MKGLVWFFVSMFSLNNQGVASIADKVPHFLKKDLTPVWSPTEQMKLAKVVSFKATEHSGQMITEKAMRGHVSLVNFFFTTCQGVCPMMMSKLQKTQKELGAVKGVEFYSFSVTPQIDTPAKLQKFAESRDLDLRNWHLLTGDKTEVYRLARESFHASKNPPGKQSKEEFIHPDQIFLIDDDLNIRGIYLSSNSRSMAHLKSDVEKLSSK